MNTTYHINYICPTCGNQCQIFGFCPICGWWKMASPWCNNIRSPWRCPGCGRYHGPHVDTCPFCQAIGVQWSQIVYVGDICPTYTGDSPEFNAKITC